MDATELRLELKVCSLDPVSTLLQHTQTELKLKSCKQYCLLSRPCELTQAALDPVSTLLQHTLDFPMQCKHC